MLHLARWLIPALLIGSLLTGGPAPGQVEKEKQSPAAYGVKDKAGLFSEEARRIADLECAYLFKRFKTDLLIETHSSAPESIKSINLQDEAAKRKFFREWAIDRGKAARVEGVIVLISTHPKYVEALASPSIERSGLLSAENASTVAQKILDRLRVGQKDDALLDATAFIRQTLSAHPDPKKE